MSLSDALDRHGRVDDPVDQVEGAGQDETGEQPVPTHGPVGVAVRHDVRVPAAVALAAAVLTVLWFSRALATGTFVDWTWCVVPASIAAAMLLALRDSRAPLLVADDHGVRVRRGVTWTGVRWSDVERVEVRGRGRGLRDGALVVHVAAAQHAEHAELADDETPVAPVFEVPLGLGTRVEVEGLTGNLVEDLDILSAGQTDVVVLTRTLPAAESVEEHEDATADEPAEAPSEAPLDAPLQEPGGDTEVEQDEVHDDQRPEPVVESDAAEVITVVLPGEHQVGTPDELPQQRTGEEPLAEPADDEPEPEAAYDEPEPGLEPDRELRAATRSEVVRESVRRLPDPAAGAAIPAQRGVEGVVTAHVEPAHEELAPIDLVAAPRPVADPVIGPLVAAARHRARLSVDTLSERTRIRPHVLECIEVDDFEPCGGDFYARGHLRTLARVFGLDAEELVRLYDERYAGGEIQARQVFEAELASGIGGGVRTATSGPRWSVLAAAVLLLVGIWGSARIFSDSPQELVSPAPEVVDSAGLAGQEPEEEAETALAAIRFTAEGEGSQVVVRDGSGRILWTGRLGDGQSQQVIGTAPFDVTASNGQAVRVSYLGEDRGTVGETTAADNRRFGD